LTVTDGPAPRVVRIIARLNVGGPARHVVILCRDLRGRYPTLLVAGSLGPDEGDMSALAREEGVHVSWVPELGRSIRLLDDVVACWKLWRLLRMTRPAIVHTHTAKAGTLGRIAAVLAGVPIRVHTYHGHVLHGYFGRWKSALFIFIERVLARITTQVIAISDKQRRELTKYLRVPDDRIRVIPLGLELESVVATDPPRARARFRQSLGVSEEDVLIGIVGRLVPIKNHTLALQALQSLGYKHPRLRLVIVGGGELEARLKAEVSDRNLTGRVIFAGWQSDLASVYAGCDAIALTSNNEGTPVCLIEALAAGRPVVATNVGGVADVLDGGRLGRLVAPGDAQALARAFDELITSSQMTVEASSQEVIARYSPGRLAADISDLYDDLCNPSGKARLPAYS
jgi:glycosyltransferase involved in cell wall biosynthesis